MRVKSGAIAVALAMLGCGGMDWASKKAELIAETSVVTTTFEHKDADFYEQSAQFGFGYTPYVLDETEGMVSTPTFEGGVVVGQYGDEARCCGHGQLGASWRFRVPNSDVVRAQLGPRAGVTIGPGPDSDLPLTPHLGGSLGVAVLGGIFAAEARLDALIAAGDSTFAWRDAQHEAIPRGGITLSTDFCAIFSGSACTHPEPRSAFVDLSPHLFATAQEIRAASSPETLATICAALTKAIVSDPWDSPAQAKVRESCPADRDACPVAEYDPPPTATHRFLAKAAAVAEGSSGAPALGRLLEEHVDLEKCVDNRRAIARRERQAGKVPTLHVVYGVYAPQIRAALGCGGRHEHVVRPLKIDVAACIASR